MTSPVSREAHISRVTNETTVELTLNLDGAGVSKIQTGQGFFDHMLDHVARHGLFDLTVAAQGDLHIDAHHTVEDVGICLGKAILQAVGEPKGLTRFGHAVVPMDETLAEAAVDFSGRPYLVFNATLPAGEVGGFDAELAEEFFYAVAMQTAFSKSFQPFAIRRVILKRIIVESFSVKFFQRLIVDKEKVIKALVYAGKQICAFWL